MTRYERDFLGIPAGFGTPEGLDPNYLNGYLGMRMRAHERQAAYGDHRLTHRSDLAGAGGFDGIHPRRRLGRRRPTGRPQPVDGRVADPFRDDQFLADFDARRTRYAGEPEGRLALDRTQRSARVQPADRLYRGGYANRGIPPAGFSEGWARGPMRGSR